jgi:hypothetical protein
MITSCGYIEDEPVKDSRIFVSDDLSAGCKIDTDRIKNMFEEIIKRDLECVKTQLDKFKFVRSVNPNLLSEADIQRFVRKFFDDPEEVIDGLNLLFQLNTLLLRDEPGTMSRANITPFFDLLIVVNRDAVEMIDIIEIMQDETDKAKFWLLRTRLENIIKRFSRDINSIIASRGGAPQSINIEDLILELTKDLDDFELGRELLNSILFVKKLFLGGSREFINTVEISRLFNLFPVFAMNVFDVFLLKEDVFEKESEYYEHIADNLEKLKFHVFEHQNEEEILNVTDLDRIIDEFIKDDKESTSIFSLFGDEEDTGEELKKIIRTFKRDLVGGNPEVFTYRDVEVSLALINLAVRSFEKISNIVDLVEDIDDKTLEEKLLIKKSFLQNFSELSIKAKELIEDNQDIPTEMKLLGFIQSIAEDTDLITIDPQLINSMFSIKVATVGGLRATVTIAELLKALDRAEDFAKLFFDLQYLSEDYFDLSDEVKFSFFELQIEGLKGLLLTDSEVENVISIADIDIIIDQFYKETDEDREKAAHLKAFVRNFKDNILISNRDHLNLQELKNSVDLGLLAFKALVFTSFHEDLKKKVDEGTEDKRIAKIKYQQEFAKLVAFLKTILENDEFLKNDIDLYGFIDELRNSRTLLDIEVDLFLSATNFKSAILGGENNTVTKNELLYLVSVSAKISSILFDMTFNELDKIEPKKELYKLLLENFNNARDILAPTYGRKVFFNLKAGLKFGDELMLYLNKNADEPKPEDEVIKVSNFKRTITDLTERYLEPTGRDNLSYGRACTPDPANPGKYICSQDDPPNSDQIDIEITSISFNKLLDVASGALQSLYFAEATFEHFEEELADPKPVDIKYYPTLPEYELIDNNLIIEFKRSFSHIAKKFKFFRNGDNYSYYQRNIVRNREGFTSLVLMRHVLVHALYAYGPEDFSGDPTTAKGIEIHHIQELLVGIKSVLEEIDLWTSNFENFGRNILLLADLFQARSNGDLFVNLDEASEFVELLFTSATISTEMIDSLSLVCENRINKDGVQEVNTKCVRENFFNSFFNDLKLEKYFPRLHKYKQTSSKAEMIEYIKGVEGFARDVPDLNIPWQKRDFALVLAAMINIESTFLRFDTSYDNILDFNELKGALEVYRNAIILLANLEGNNKKLARTVFFYMVKYMKAPSPVTVWSLDKIFKLHFKNTRAKRINIGTLLYYLVNNAEGAQEKSTMKTIKNSLSELGPLLESFGAAMAEKTGEEIEELVQEVHNMYLDTKRFLGF